MKGIYMFRFLISSPPPWRCRLPERRSRAMNGIKAPETVLGVENRGCFRHMQEGLPPSPKEQQ